MFLSVLAAQQFVATRPLTTTLFIPVYKPQPIWQTSPDSASFIDLLIQTAALLAQAKKSLHQNYVGIFPSVLGQDQKNDLYPQCVAF